MRASTSVRESPSWRRRQARENARRFRIPVRLVSRPPKTASAILARSRCIPMEVLTMVSTRFRERMKLRARSVADGEDA